MHFSRMRTVRLSGRLEGGACQGDVCLPQGVWLSMGCVCPGSVCLPRCVCLPGVCVYQGLSTGGVLPSRGCVYQGGVCLSGGICQTHPHGQNNRHV